MTEKNPVKVLIADDSKLTIVGLKTTLKQFSDIEIIGEANDGQIAIEMAAKLKPDVILMDISLKGELNGVDTARKIYKYYKPLIIFISALDKLAFDFSGLEYKFMSKPILDKNLISILNYS